MSETVREAQSGDLAAFDRVVRRTQDSAVAYAVSLLGDRDLAQSPLIGSRQSPFWAERRGRAEIADLLRRHGKKAK